MDYPLLYAINNDQWDSLRNKVRICSLDLTLSFENDTCVVPELREKINVDIIGMQLRESEFMMEICSSIYKCIHVLQLDKVFNKM